MALFGRNATTVGLDIGSGLIKLVVISHASGGPVLTKVAFTSVVNDAIVEGEVMDPGIVAEAIKGLMASAGIKAKKVVTAVGGRDVIIKKIAMDRMKEAEAREAHPLGSGAARAVRHGQRRARLPDPRSRRRRPAR